MLGSSPVCAFATALAATRAGVAGRIGTRSIASRAAAFGIRSVGSHTNSVRHGITTNYHLPASHSSRRDMATDSSASSNNSAEFVTLAQPAPGSPFHYAFPVHSLDAAKEFYGNVLGCAEGRSSEKWQDYSLHGHQIVCHWVGNDYRCVDYFNPVDGDEVPVPHVGLALTEEQFHELAQCEGCWCEIYHRASFALQGTAGGAVDHVLQGPQWKQLGVQGDDDDREFVCQVQRSGLKLDGTIV